MSRPPDRVPEPAGDDRELSVIETRRFVNDSLFETANSFGGSDAHRYEFVCECDDLRCQELVMVSRDDYLRLEPGSVRAHN
jgi:hypothetical protein